MSDVELVSLLLLVFLLGLIPGFAAGHRCGYAEGERER